MKELLSDGERLIMLVRVELGAVMVRPMDCGRGALCITPMVSVEWVHLDEDLDGVLTI